MTQIIVTAISTAILIGLALWRPRERHSQTCRCCKLPRGLYPPRFL